MNHSDASALIDKVTVETRAGRARWSWVGQPGQPLFEARVAGRDVQVVKENGTFRLWEVGKPDNVEIRHLSGDALASLRPQLEELWTLAKQDADGSLKSP